MDVCVGHFETAVVSSLCVFMQPAVCTRELCVFSFYTLGVMSGAAEEVATGAEVTTTLIIHLVMHSFGYLIFF